MRRKYTKMLRGWFDIFPHHFSVSPVSSIMNMYLLNSGIHIHIIFPRRAGVRSCTQGVVSALSGKVRRGTAPCLWEGARNRRTWGGGCSGCHVTFHCVMVWVQLPFYVSPGKARVFIAFPEGPIQGKRTQEINPEQHHRLHQARSWTLCRTAAMSHVWLFTFIIKLSKLSKI